jgi:peptide-methionine (R)-S-oxide reductase
MFSYDKNDEQLPRPMGRRAFLTGIGVAAMAAVFAKLQGHGPVHAAAAAAAAAGGEPKLVTIVEFTDGGLRKDSVTISRIVKTDAEWRKQLSPDAYKVTREAATERPYSGELLNVHDKGVFRCICCDTALFDSSTKFESGTGWPSFWAPIAKENILEKIDLDLGMPRTAVSCRLCDAHLGHVFDDGPRPTGLRYCMNSLALKFAKAS